MAVINILVLVNYSLSVKTNFCSITSRD